LETETLEGLEESKDREGRTQADSVLGIKGKTLKSPVTTKAEEK
jgi:hypothetical protein